MRPAEIAAWKIRLDSGIADHCHGWRFEVDADVDGVVDLKCTWKPKHATPKQVARMSEQASALYWHHFDHAA